MIIIRLKITLIFDNGKRGNKKERTNDENVRQKLKDMKDGS